MPEGIVPYSVSSSSDQQFKVLRGVMPRWKGGWRDFALDLAFVETVNQVSACSDSDGHHSERRVLARR
jgi:hypothetical protein